MHELTQPIPQSEIEPKKVVINKMPTMEELADFMQAFNGGAVIVSFDIEKGEFVRLEDKQGK